MTAFAAICGILIITDNGAFAREIIIQFCGIGTSFLFALIIHPASACDKILSTEARHDVGLFETRLERERASGRRLMTEGVWGTARSCSSVQAAVGRRR